VYRLTETDHYPLADTSCRAVYLMMQEGKSRLEAVVSPEWGMSLLAFTRDGVSFLQKSRTRDFREGRKGLGPLIFPHFNQRGSFPRVPDEVLQEAPHAAYLRRQGVDDPFQHGIGRYASWEYEARSGPEGAMVTGTLTGASVYRGVPVREIVGFDFTAFVSYVLREGNLLIRFNVHADEPVVCGIHFYYRLAGSGSVALSVLKEGMNDDETPFVFSDHARKGKFYTLPVGGENDVDTLFYPVSEKDGYARYKLEAGDYRLDTRVRVEGPPEETFDAVVVFSPAGSDFVCVEPLSDARPFTPSKKVFKGEIVLHPVSVR